MVIPGALSKGMSAAATATAKSPLFPTLFATKFKAYASENPDTARTRIVALMRAFHDMVLPDAPTKAADLRSALAMFEESAANRKFTISYAQLVELLEMYGSMIYGIFERRDDYLVSKFKDASMLVSAPTVPTGALSSMATPAAPVVAAPVIPLSIYALLSEEKGKRTAAGFARLLSDFNQQVKLQVYLDRSTKKDQSSLLQTLDLVLQAFLKTPTDALS